jgi:plasmid stability protein
MKVLNIRRLPDDIHARLRMRAARNGRSMEAEARDILSRAVRPDDTGRMIRELQAAVRRSYRGPRSKSVVEEFIAEKRLEAEREEAQWSSSTPPHSSR